MYKILENLRNAIVNGFDDRAREFYHREFEFFKEVTSVSGKIKHYPKGNVQRVMEFHSETERIQSVLDFR